MKTRIALSAVFLLAGALFAWTGLDMLANAWRFADYYPVRFLGFAFLGLAPLMLVAVVLAIFAKAK